MLGTELSRSINEGFTRQFSEFLGARCFPSCCGFEQKATQKFHLVGLLNSTPVKSKDTKIIELLIPKSRNNFNPNYTKTRKYWTHVLLALFDKITRTRQTQHLMAPKSQKSHLCVALAKLEDELTCPACLGLLGGPAMEEFRRIIENQPGRRGGRGDGGFC